MTGVNLQIDDEKAKELLEMCINLWITICENSFANSIKSSTSNKQNRPWKRQSHCIKLWTNNECMHKYYNVVIISIVNNSVIVKLFGIFD